MNEMIENKVQNETAGSDKCYKVQKLKLKTICIENIQRNNVNESELQLVLTKVMKTSPLTYSLKHLDLSYLGLNILPIDLIHLNCLTKLSISHNFLKTVPDCIYNGLPRLKILDLSYNKIQEFSEPKCMLSLTVLSINDNLLKIIPRWIWEYSCRLSELNINNNPMDMKNYGIMAKTAISVSRFKKLSISNCNLQNRNKDILRNIPYLVHLNIGNNVYGINKNYWDFDIFILQCRPQIQNLFLQNLGISTLPNEICEFSSLKAIYLDKNIIYSLPETLCSLHNLIICSLSENQLTSLPDNFSNLINLEELYLANNLLSELPNVSNLRKLRILDLYNNFITYIDMDRLSCIEALDVECNFLVIISEYYLEKKNKLRTKIEELLRQDGCKEYEYASSNNSDAQENSLSYTSEINEYETEVLNDSTQNHIQDNDEENWDEDIEDYYIPTFYQSINSINTSKNLVSIKQETNYYFYKNFVDAD